MERLELALEIVILIILDIVLSILPLFEEGWKGAKTLLGFLALSLIITMGSIKAGKLSTLPKS